MSNQSIPPRARKVVLAYSGGVDTSTCIPFLKDTWGVEEVITLTCDLGGSEVDLAAVQQKARDSGATHAIVSNVASEFAHHYVFPAIQANALYQGKYPMATALGRPLIARTLVEVAHEFGADAVAHGCTGQGNDQVRFDVAIKLLDPKLMVLAPAREWGMSREQCIDYLTQRGIAVAVGRSSPYSYDCNPAGNAIEGGPIENPWAQPPEDCYLLTSALANTPDEPQIVEIGFCKGLPATLNGSEMEPLALLQALNTIAGRHGFGRVDMVEDRVVGIKTREVYEAPGMLALITAHRDLEEMTLMRDVLRTKFSLEQQYADLVYGGQWLSPLKSAIDAFIQETQRTVTGDVRLRFFKGGCTVIGRQSPSGLYQYDLATYGERGQFNPDAAPGFIELYGLPASIWRQVNPQI